MVYVLAIDPGMRNLAYCMTDESGEIVAIGRDDIFQGKAIETPGCYDCIQAWCEYHDDMLKSATVVIIERQFVDRKVVLSSCLTTIQTVLMCRTQGKHILVHAMAIKRFFNTRADTHRGNKAASTQCATTMCPDLKTAVTGKLDDVADAYLMCQYGLRSGLLQNIFSHADDKDGRPRAKRTCRKD